MDTRFVYTYKKTYTYYRVLCIMCTTVKLIHLYMHLSYLCIICTYIHIHTFHLMCTWVKYLKCTLATTTAILLNTHHPTSSINIPMHLLVVIVVIVKWIDFMNAVAVFFLGSKGLHATTFDSSIMMIITRGESATHNSRHINHHTWLVTVVAIYQHHLHPHHHHRDHHCCSLFSSHASPVVNNGKVVDSLIWFI